ncbi:putative mediator of RNA polymerase II transcription subunit 12 isoform X3 [Drosophila sulfurigaster albostrigata]|uniref:putative mediator of RNA polymerase II transcription subunit 12 isoform X3 n=1 Tax=Drosophila sulfurigaster albostrigata TaxID=89887 RepID=UPI002D21DF19|nr:putative mediator of RNA polymerase II transcription subunit 12 isoform X3 [Drosophila sulfurigaster albostrigata]
MNNFTTTTAAVPKKESLPRSGHVNEVCKEWLVREDGALAYKLQSQEINDFYKGNRYRNAVVREDFPTALHEQIKETEQAQRQVEAYRRRLTEQEEHDKRVAKEIADKLERDLQEQQQKELQQSELIAQKMQEIYVNLPPVPPPATRDKSRPPPRPAKASIHQQQQQQLQQQQQQQHQLLTNGSLEPSTSQQARYLSQQQQQQQQPLQLQQQHFSQTDNYVGLSLIPNILEMPTAAAAAAAATPSRQAQQQAHAQLQTQQQQHNNQLLKLSPEKYDQMVGNFALPNAKAVERHMQQHADDIELYVDLCEYGSLRDIGVPAEEALEMSKKLKQEQKDEILARRLQAIESKDNMRQEQRDRMLAIEAQDKELAKMLQEREKAKVKRAKEKARLRKSQQKEAANGGNSSSSSLLCGTNGLASHCGPLLSLPQDCMSASSSTSQAQLDIDVEAYSNPIDVLNSSRQAQEQQRQPNGLLTNGSLTRDSSSSQGSMQRQQRQAAAAAHSLNRGDDDIYTLPVDSCRLGIQGQRPISLHMAAETVQQQQQQQQQHNSMTRSEHFGSEAGSHDSTLSSGHDVSPHMKYSKSGGNFGIYIKAPAPRRLTCQFRVHADRIQVKIVKRNPRTTSARINESSTSAAATEAAAHHYLS